jgi:hypothetical protein
LLSASSTVIWTPAYRNKIAFHIAVFLTALLIAFSRRPDAILNAQFWAEDGKYWYADAYHFGLRCLLMPEAGYLHTLPRLIALFTLLFPLALAPLVMNFCALVIQILPVNLFLSSRFDSVSFDTRLLGSLLYLALPNSSEIHANTTNIQWHLALLALLVMLAPFETSRLWRLTDFPALFFVSLDGPLGILLVPVGAVLLWKRKDARSVQALAVLLPGVILQTLTMLLTRSRHLGSTGANVTRLVSILGRQVFLGSLLGMSTLVDLTKSVHSLFFFEAMAAVAGLAILFYALRNGPLELKLFISFAALIFAACLSRPLADQPGYQWEIMRGAGNFGRYYFFPMLAFLAALLWLVQTSKTRTLRYAALAVLLVMPIGILRDWRYAPFLDLDFQGFAAAFDRAAPGTRFIVPINPDWQMQLVKKP